MLLTTRPTSFKIFSTAALVSLLVVFCFNWYIWGLGGDRRFFDPFADSKCGSEAGLVAAECVQATVTITLDHTISVTPAPITITITSGTKTQTSLPTATAIPEKIWYKLGPKGLSDDTKGWISSCLDKNPSYQREFLTDASGDHYVKAHFANRPDIVDAFLQFSIPILKADLLRYLILYAEGGVWSDLDVSCEEGSIQDWVPEQYKADAALVVGLEFDWDWEDDNFLHSQFASWTIMAKRGSPHMMMVVDDILENMHTKAEENNVPISGLTMEMVGEIVDATGPKRMTRSIVKSMELVLEDTVDDRNISGLHEPKLIGDVLILPGNAFAARQSGYPSDQGPTYVEHHYAGTWKNDHGGELT